MSPKKKTALEPEEIDLFRKHCQGVTPLSSDTVHLRSNPTPKTRPITPRKKRDDYEPPQHLCSAEDRLHFSKPGIQRKILHNLHRGHIVIEATLDLHRLRMAEAIEVTETFLQHCQQQGFRWVLIVHGKGHYSKDSTPMLKSLLSEWLPAQACVLAFESAQAKHGGAGALYVLLKRERAHV